MLEMGRSSAAVMVQREVLYTTAAVRKPPLQRLCVGVCVKERESGVPLSRVAVVSAQREKTI